ncbi:MFS transporter [Paenarthrobacter nitroguajacolicus]|uniref:MFS transporter n=1 Tax=Paenarthrobacter nitroguajacolicus TaxID=211146 RepID=UPI0028648A45|nr:MFS transporter [Paenarthrobacter nitroguajacolicus]MDR6637033.1 sugar phosphate permease [Paenarthrobacter nitroguajacolicus]
MVHWPGVVDRSAAGLSRGQAGCGTPDPGCGIRVDYQVDSGGRNLVGYIVDTYGISVVFTVFAAVALIAGLVTIFFAIETKGRVLEELSP